MPEIIDQDFDWIEPFKAKEIHFVCVASGGLTTCDFAASTIGGMDQREAVWPKTRRVNDLGETGTFHPRLPLTVVPLPSWEKRPLDDLEGFLRKSFQDVAEANCSHIKLRTVVIDLNGWGGDYPFEMARRVAEEILSHESTIQKLIFLPKVPSNSGR